LLQQIFLEGISMRLTPLGVLLALFTVSLTGCGAFSQAPPAPTGSIETPALNLTGDVAVPETGAAAGPRISLEPTVSKTDNSPPVSSVLDSNEKLRADVRTLDANSLRKLVQQTSTTLTFSGAIVMSPGNVFVMKGTAYKATDVQRLKGQVIVTIETPTANEVYDPFDRPPAFKPAASKGGPPPAS
jgi:hypothetical protein